MNIDLNKCKSEKGFYFIPKYLWIKLSRDDQSKIKLSNGRLRKKRGRADVSKKEIVSQITQRHTGNEDKEKPKRKLKTVLLKDDDDDETSGDEEKTSKSKSITNRREILTFRMSDE